MQLFLLAHSSLNLHNGYILELKSNIRIKFGGSQSPNIMNLVFFKGLSRRSWEILQLSWMHPPDEPFCSCYRGFIFVDRMLLGVVG